MDGEEATAPEDVSKWTVDDVCSFVGGLSGCGEYAPVRGPTQDGSEHPPLPSAASHPRFPLLKDCGGGGHWCTHTPPPHIVSVSASKVGHAPSTEETFLPFDALSCKLHRQLLWALLSLESSEATPGRTAPALTP